MPERAASVSQSCGTPTQLYPNTSSTQISWHLGDNQAQWGNCRKPVDLAIAENWKDCQLVSLNVSLKVKALIERESDLTPGIAFECELFSPWILILAQHFVSTDAASWWRRRRIRLYLSRHSCTPREMIHRISCFLTISDLSKTFENSSQVSLKFWRRMEIMK